MLINRIFFLLFIMNFSLLFQKNIFSSQEKHSKHLLSIINNDQKEILKKFSRGESFRQGQTVYTVYPNLKAFFNEDKNVTKLMKDKLFLTESLTIYNFPRSDVKGKYQNQVVFNETSETFGILSGAIIVKMKNNLEFNDPSFDILKKYPELGYYILELPFRNKIQDSIKKIQLNRNVEEFMIEILENFYETL